MQPQLITSVVTGPEDDDQPATIEYRRGSATYIVNVWVSALDDVTVVQIDTDNADRFRVNINDEAVWDGNPDRDEWPGAFFEQKEV